METGVSIAGHDRVTAYHAERSWFSYLYATLGGALFLTMAMVLVVVWSSLVPAFADEAPIVKGPGPGYYDVYQLRGPARREVKAYLDATYVDCEFETKGRCNLNAVTDHVDIIYVSAPGTSYALAFISYEPDTGNAGGLQLALWHQQDQDGYGLIATGPGWNLEDQKAIGVVGQTIVLSGLTLGPDDARCCLTDPTVYRVAFADGKISVSFAMQIPVDGRTVFTDPDFPKDAARDSLMEKSALRSAVDSSERARYVMDLKLGRKDHDQRTDLAYADGKLSVTPARKPVRRPANDALAMLSGGGPLPVLNFAKPGPKSKVSGFDFSHSNYAGEAPLTFFHNDSEMMVFPTNGIIAYKAPKASLAGVVGETDILFQGTMGKSTIFGTAYVFKKGCAPLAYPVSGPGYRSRWKGVPSAIVLTGVAPIRARNSCEIVGATINGRNSVLRFEPAGFYAEDALEAETHSGAGYGVVAK